jgi:hypothetical protein
MYRDFFFTFIHIIIICPRIPSSNRLIYKQQISIIIPRILINNRSSINQLHRPIFIKNSQLRRTPRPTSQPNNQRILVHIIPRRKQPIKNIIFFIKTYQPMNLSLWEKTTPKSLTQLHFNFLKKNLQK